MIARTALAAFALCLASAAALAETSPAPGSTVTPTAPNAAAATGAAPDTGHRFQACQADVQKLCGTVDKSVHGAVRACLTSHATELSDACKTGMAQRAAEHAAATTSKQ